MDVVVVDATPAESSNLWLFDSGAPSKTINHNECALGSDNIFFFFLLLRGNGGNVESSFILCQSNPNQLQVQRQRRH